MMVVVTMVKGSRKRLFSRGRCSVYIIKMGVLLADTVLVM
jgi:hypothetical protein